MALPATTTWSAQLRRLAARLGGKDAFRFEGEDWAGTLTFGAWARAAERYATALAAAGVGAGDRVAIVAPSGPVWPVAQVACSHLGAILVPVNLRYRSDEIAHTLALARPKLALVIERHHLTDYAALVSSCAPDLPIVTLAGPDAEADPAFLAAADGQPAPPDVSTPDSAVLMQFTSGTSAFPKAALLGNWATLGATGQLALRMGIAEDDVYFSTQPMYHVGGSVATILMALAAGCTMVVPARYSVDAVFRMIPKYGCTVRTGQAAMYAMEMAHPDFSPDIFRTVKKAWSGGSAELKRSIRDVMGIPEITTIYGLTETAGTTTVTARDDPDNVRWDSCGRPIAGVEVGIAHDGVIDTAPDTPGEICVRGWSVMLGYYGDPPATAAAIDPAGWFHTGDLGRLDRDGYLYFIDRIKDMIKPGGENVSAAEVERVIFDHPAVAEVAVVGMPDSRLGEVPAAFVELRTGATASEADLVSWCASRIASFKVPRRVFFVGEWPMTESGKIQKRVLRERFGTAGAGRIGQTG